MRLLFAILLFGLVSGCANRLYWNFPPGGTTQQFHQDEYACLQESQQRQSSAAVNRYGGSSQSGSATNAGLYKACMYARGYREGKRPR
ncbi:MAG: hypothetical protein K0Q43_670 [Ramlibacter sp.]|jgi:hypothetical protein|nr:hypothetical protein [Ramlibacter sp.]